MTEQLTAGQIENWRKVLLGMVGPIAIYLTGEEIQAMRDKMQSHVSESAAPERGEDSK